MTPKLKCPKDGRLLEANSIGELPHLSCPKCHGLLFTADHLRRLSPSLAGIDNLPKPAVTEGRVEEAQGQVSCPCSDSVAMDAVLLRGIEVDRCPKCSAVFFDRDELQKLWSISAEGHPMAPGSLSSLGHPSSSGAGLKPDGWITTVGDVLVEILLILL